MDGGPGKPRVCGGDIFFGLHVLFVFCLAGMGTFLDLIPGAAAAPLALSDVCNFWRDAGRHSLHSVFHASGMVDNSILQLCGQLPRHGAARRPNSARDDISDLSYDRNLPLIISSNRNLRFFGGLLIGVVAVTYAFFIYAYVSVFCFGGAVMSSFLVWMVFQETADAAK